LGRAIGELGRIPKTLHMLRFIDDENYRRRILTQLNRGEGRHRLARAVFHASAARCGKRYREGQEDRCGWTLTGALLRVYLIAIQLYYSLELRDLSPQARHSGALEASTCVRTARRAKLEVKTASAI